MNKKKEKKIKNTRSIKLSFWGWFAQRNAMLKKRLGSWWGLLHHHESQAPGECRNAIAEEEVSGEKKMRVEYVERYLHLSPGAYNVRRPLGLHEGIRPAIVSLGGIAENLHRKQIMHFQTPHPKVRFKPINRESPYWFRNTSYKARVISCLPN